MPYACICMYIYTYIYVYISLSIYICVHIYTCVYVYICFFHTESVLIPFMQMLHPTLMQCNRREEPNEITCSNTLIPTCDQVCNRQHQRNYHGISTMHLSRSVPLLIEVKQAWQQVIKDVGEDGHAHAVACKLAHHACTS